MIGRKVDHERCNFPLVFLAPHSGSVRMNHRTPSAGAAERQVLRRHGSSVFVCSAIFAGARSASAARTTLRAKAPSQTSIMNKLCIFVGMFVVSTAVGLGADALGCSFFTSFLLSGVGAMVGVWLGWWLHRRYFG